MLIDLLYQKRCHMLANLDSTLNVPLRIINIENEVGKGFWRLEHLVGRSKAPTCDTVGNSETGHV